MNKKTLIYLAGINVISKHGFYNTKVQDVVNEAGVSVGSFYNYFKDKNDLLFYIFELRMAKLNEILNNIITMNINPVDKINQFIDFLEQHFYENVELETTIKENFWYFHKLLSHDNSSKYIELGLEFENKFIEIIKEGQKLGLINDTDPKSAYQIISSIMFNYHSFYGANNNPISQSQIKDIIKLTYYTY